MKMVKSLQDANFNLSEIIGWDELQEQENELYKKIDGSLIIMFHYKGKHTFCTRGSFCSDQALKAEEIFNKKYSDQDVMRECTYCLHEGLPFQQSSEPSFLENCLYLPLLQQGPQDLKNF